MCTLLNDSIINILYEYRKSLLACLGQKALAGPVEEMPVCCVNGDDVGYTTF